MKQPLDTSEISKRFQSLKAGSLTPQHRGYAFEELIYSVLHHAGLEPRTGYKPEGEQVDGSFFWQGSTFLIEAKWTTKPIAASEIYSFKGKLDGKFHTTSGLFLSWSGYSDDAEDALKFGKALNIILFDQTDIEQVFSGAVQFLDILKYKLREAGDTGTLRAPYTIKEEAKKLSLEDFFALPDLLPVVKVKKSKSVTSHDILFFVEGKSDIKLMKQLLMPIQKFTTLTYKIHILQGAGNVRLIPALVNEYISRNKIKGVVIVLDDDENSRSIRGVLENVIQQIEQSSIEIPSRILLLSDQLKAKLLLEVQESDVTTESIYKELETFVRELVQDNYDYDPERDLPLETFKGIMGRAIWEYDEKLVSGFEDYDGREITIKSIKELIEYLNEEVVQAMQGEMPMHWLKEQEYLDYEDEAYYFLQRYYAKEIRKMGWELD